MKVLVCGGRDFYDPVLLKETLQRLKEDNPDMVIIHGGAKGADNLASLWAKLNSVRQEVYRAEWVKYGKSAGMRRNKHMLKQGKPDLVVAFKGGKGTQNMIDIATKAGVPVLNKGVDQ